MDFEQLKVIWDSQNDEPLYAVNEAALHAIVRRRKEQEHRRTFWCYGREIVINALCGLATFGAAGVLAWGDPAWLQSLSWINVAVSPWHVAALVVAGVLWLHCANHMWSARRRQLQREQSLATSLQGDLERALAHIDFQIGIARSIVWWGLLPAWVAAVLSVVVMFHLKGASGWPYLLMSATMVIAFGLALACQHFVIHRRYRPRQRELATLRAKLADPRH